MTVLGTIDRCLNLIPKDLIESGIVYVELSTESYDLVDKEMETILAGFQVQEAKVPDMGKCKTLQRNGNKIIIVVNKDAKDTGSFYFAFKTKVI